jgi:hypothetical protein
MRSALRVSAPISRVPASAWLEDPAFADASADSPTLASTSRRSSIGMKDGKVGILFGVDNVEAAKSALGELSGVAAG